SLRQDLTTQAETLAETQELAWSQIQNLQERLSETEATLDSLHAAPAAEPAAGAETAAALSSLRQDLATQTSALDGLRDATQQQFVALNDALEIRQQESREIAGQVGQLQTVTLEQLQQAGQAQIQQIQALQHRLDATETTLDLIRQAPEPGAGAIDLEEALAPLRQDLFAQAGNLDKLQDAAQQQFAELSAALEIRQQEALETAGQLHTLQQDVEKFQQQPAADPTAYEQRLEDMEVYSRKFQEDLTSIQETMTALEFRLSSQSQAYSGNFEQFRALNAEIHTLHQKIAQLEAPQQLDIEQELAAYQHDIAQLREAVEQIQADSQPMGETIESDDAESPVAKITARLDEQQEQLNALTTMVETVRADAKSTQETVVTMATNVAKRIHEIQNLLVATETTQGERLQEVEQKLIWLQAALETMESQKTKPRRWFSMPASLTSVLLTVGAASGALLAEIAWIIN
ncbi:MAG: hypothetical protein KDI50_09255, partial [Candidatus Competibacteraceae bacterium]|nr:hypothetical protein [Candidatus Competibacteraceae bacterium]